MLETEGTFDIMESAVMGTLLFANRLVTPLSLVGIWMLSVAVLCFISIHLNHMII